MMHHAERSDEPLEELLANHAAVHFVLYSTIASLQHKVNQKALQITNLVDYIQEFGGTMPSTLHRWIQDIYHTLARTPLAHAMSEAQTFILARSMGDDTERMDRLMQLAVLRDSSDEGDAQSSQTWATSASS